jgi:hypothetical protein
MGPLENKMHEKFVQEYVKNGRNGLQGYKAVYPNVKDRSAGACAARLLAVARVAERFKELQAASAEGAKVTLEGLIKAARRHRDERDKRQAAFGCGGGVGRPGQACWPLGRSD